MLQLAFLILVGITVVICLVFGILMLVLPVPHSEAINHYRIFRKLVAMAFLTMAGVNIAGFFIDPNVADQYIVRFITLIIALFQAFLFTYALITLINIEFLTKKRAIKELVPMVIISVFCSVGLIIKLPATVLNAIFYTGTAYYVFQLIYYTFLFSKQFRGYHEKLDNFTSEKEAFQLRWIQFSFYLAFSVGIMALISVFVTSTIVASFFIAVYAFFYLFFGIKYLNYIYVFKAIEPITHPEPMVESPRLSNDEIADAVEHWIRSKGFLQNGITLIDLAAHLNTNRTYLSNYINQRKGMNFNAWVNWLRVEESKVLLLENPQTSILEVSEQLGYSEQSNFGRYFLRYTGTTPRQWRQNCCK